MQTWDPEEALDTLMDRIARPCIGIHRPFPPPLTRIGRSKFGGMPNLPADIEWPRGRSFHSTKPQATPLHFMAQVDCAELPRVGDALPTSGMLFFFANMCDDGAWYDNPPNDCRRVIYAPHVPADQPVRMPPRDLPRIEPATILDNPHGYWNGHVPDDPLTGKVYFDWPMQFAAIDSYPEEGVARETAAWSELAAVWNARAGVDAAFMKEWGPADDGAMGTVYHDRSADRMCDRLFTAMNVPWRNEGRAEPLRGRRRWHELDTQTGGSFPPTAAFASTIATTIDERLLNESVRHARWPNVSRHPAAQAAKGTGTLFAQLQGRIKGLFGRRAAPAEPPPPAAPDYLEDLEKVRQEAAAWLRETRALASDHPLDPETRRRFLAWLDELFDRNWLQKVGLGYMFDAAIFRLVQLSASDASIRAGLPGALYESYGRSGRAVCRHQMLGYFRSEQAPRPADDPMVPLLTLSYDLVPGFHICDVGEMQFFIRHYDLRDRDFDHVEVQMQGG